MKTALWDFAIEAVSQNRIVLGYIGTALCPNILCFIYAYTLYAHNFQTTFPYDLDLAGAILFIASDTFLTALSFFPHGLNGVVRKIVRHTLGFLVGHCNPLYLILGPKKYQIESDLAI